jgi:predicted permease
VTILTDLRTALKSLCAGARTTVAAIAILALGTAANVAVLTVAYGALARPLPFADAARLIVVSTARIDDVNPGGGSVRMEELGRWRAGLRTVSGVAGWTSGEFTMQGLDVPASVRAAIVTDNFFEVLGASAEIGRVFRGPADAGLAVLARHLAPRADASASLSKNVTIGALSLRVAGVMPATFPLPDRVDLWIPAQSVDALDVGRFSNMRSFRMVARLRPGVTIAQALDDAARVLRELELERGRQPNEMRAVVTPLRDTIVGDRRPVLVAFLAAAALVLAVACANVATLLVSQSLGRQREFAVRLALGASTARLVRTAVLESAVIAGCAAILGAAIAAAVLRALPALVEGVFPRAAFMSLTWPALAASAVVAAVATTLAGVGPAFAAARSNFAPAFRTTTSAGSVAGRRTRAALVVVQIAVAVVLLVGAGLLTRTVLQLLDTDLGVGTEISQSRTMTLRLRMTPMSRFDAGARGPFVDDLVRRVRQLPGVEAAGIGTNVPPTTAPIAFSLRIVPENGPVEMRTFDLGSATAGYFEAIGARLIRGRWFDERDDASRPVAVLTETAVRYLGRTNDPIGRPLAVGLPALDGVRLNPTVIGIIQDVRHHGLETPASGGIYVLWSQVPAGFSFLAVRTAGPVGTIAPSILRVLREADPTLPIPEVRTLEQETRQSILAREVRVALVGTFAALAIMLAVAGLAGALARSVTERRREIAIRAALGATPGLTTRLVLREGLLLQAIGLTLGIGIAFALAQSAATLLYGVSARDPLTFTGVAAAVTLLGLAAAWVPARRAARVQPQELLRGD